MAAAMIFSLLVAFELLPTKLDGCCEFPPWGHTIVQRDSDVIVFLYVGGTYPNVLLRHIIPLALSR